MGDSEHSVSRNLNRDLLRLKRRFSTGSVFVLTGKKTPALPPQKRTRLAGFSSSACLRPFSVPLCPGKLASADDIIWLPGSLQLVHTWPLDSSEKWWGRGVGWEWWESPWSRRFWQFLHLSPQPARRPLAFGSSIQRAASEHWPSHVSCSFGPRDADGFSLRPVTHHRHTRGRVSEFLCIFKSCSHQEVEAIFPLPSNQVQMCLLCWPTESKRNQCAGPQGPYSCAHCREPIQASWRAAWDERPRGKRTSISVKPRPRRTSQLTPQPRAAAARVT